MAGPYDALKKATGISPEPGLFEQVIEALVGAVGLSGVPVPTATGPARAVGDTRASRLGEAMAMLAGVPSLTKGAGAALDMSRTARMSRAQSMEFRLNMPLYHGTAQEISAFDLARGGRTTGSPVGSLGVSTARSPDVAEEFADMAAHRWAGGSGQNILPLFHRAQRPARIDLTGHETNQQIAATLQDAWDKEYDAVLFTNYTTPSGVTGQQIVVVKNPAQLRSPQAAFDPRKRNSSDLLAGLSLPLAAGAASQVVDER